MQKQTKAIIMGLLFIVVLCLGLWLFNHVNPWIGIGFCVLIIGVVMNYAFRRLNKAIDEVKPKSE